jgi:hypothetical protein
MARIALRCGEREQGHARRDREHRDPLPTSDVLAEPPRRDREHEDEARPEQRLHQRERRACERVPLRDPAGEAERRPGHPERPAHEPPEEREAQRMLGRRVPGLEGLERDPDRVERRRDEGGDDADQEVGHGRQAR